MQPTTGHPDIVVVGASAGGVNALIDLVGGLPADLAASVLVVLHVPRDAPSALPAILSRNGALRATAGEDGERIQRAHIHVAPTDRHLMVIDGHLRLSRGPTENGHRPAIDPLFRSASRAYGPRVIGVVLSGSRDDGSAGLATIARRGGYTLVQDPGDALHSPMPLAALARVEADHVAPAAKLGALVAELVANAPLRPTPEQEAEAELLDAEIAVARLAPVPEELRRVPAGFGCPECGGSLFELDADPVPRFRCRVGHAWSAQSLLDAHSDELHGALWMAMRALEEKAALATRMADTTARSRYGTGKWYRQAAEEATRAAELLRGLIANVTDASPGHAV